MITDQLTNLRQYATLQLRFKTVCDYIESVDLYKLSDGKYVIDGDSIFMTVASGELRTADEAPLEVHNRYMDIQIVLSDKEQFGWRTRNSCIDPRGDYSVTNDILFYDDKPSAYIDVLKGEMIIFMPQDAHAPLIGKGAFRKCIVKVLCDE